MADLNKFGAIQTDDMFVENTSKRLCTPFLFANIGKMGNVRSLYKKGRKTNFIAYNSTLPLQSSISWSTQHMRTPNIDGGSGRKVSSPDNSQVRGRIPRNLPCFSPEDSDALSTVAIAVVAVVEDNPTIANEDGI
ncbi:hypothetical protein E2P81_ATG07850 [Venturia nashicola]|nr:hypothetical protein E2P81_ATG07850 [Venturia nashicola]